MSGRSTDISSASNGVAVTCGDTSASNIPPTRGLYLSVAGDVKVTWAGGGTTVMKTAPAGERPWQVIRVWSTGTTTTTDIVALY